MAFLTKSKNPFNVLGFNQGVLNGLDEKQIRQLAQSQFRSLSLIHHPDLSGGSDASAKKFTDISVAYDMLSNSSSEVFNVLLKEFMSRTSASKSLEESVVEAARIKKENDALRAQILENMTNASAVSFKSDGDFTVFDRGFSISMKDSAKNQNILQMVEQRHGSRFVDVPRINQDIERQLAARNNFVLKVEADGSITKRFFDEDKNSIVCINYPTRRLFAIIPEEEYKKVYSKVDNLLIAIFNNNIDLDVILGKKRYDESALAIIPPLTQQNSTVIENLIKLAPLMRLNISPFGMLLSIGREGSSGSRSFHVEGTVNNYENPSALFRVDSTPILYPISLHDTAIKGAKLESVDYIMNIVNKRNAAMKIGGNKKRPFTVVDYARELLSGKKSGSESLRGADMSSYDLSNLNLSSVHLEATILRKAKFTEIMAVRSAFNSADMSECNMSGSVFVDSIFYMANLSNALMNRSNFSGTNFSSAILTGAQAIGSEFTLSDFTGANMHGMAVNGSTFKRAIFKGADMRALTMRGMDLSGCDFTNADLTDADLSGSNLSGAIFEGAKLNGAKLVGAIAAATRFTGSDLFGADFSDSNVLSADFSNANGIGDAIFAGANRSFSIQKGVKTNLMPFISTEGIALRGGSG